MEFAGIRFLGLTSATATKLGLTALIGGALVAARQRITAKYGVELDPLDPRVYWTLTDNWLEMRVRFVVPDHGIREIKDRINRTILREFDAAGLEIASATVDISSVPPLRVEPAGPLSSPPGRP
jgi:hypothetical protein